MSRSRVNALLTAAVLALPLGACGKGGTPSRDEAGTSSAKASTAQKSKPKAPLAKGKGSGSEGGPAVSAAGAAAFARAVNLTAGDLPGFARTSKGKEHETPAERELERRLARCTGGRLAGTSESSEHSSGQFRRKGNAFDQTIGSSVSFLRVSTPAGAELQALRSARTRDCLRTYLNERFSGKSFGGASIRRVAVTQGTPPAPGTAGGFGWRITAVVELRRVQVPFYLDILGFVDGHAEVALTSTGLLIPFPAAREERLYRLLLARTHAHRL